MRTKTPRKNFRKPHEVLGARGALHLALPDGRLINIPSGGSDDGDRPQFRSSVAVLDDCLAAGERYREIREMPDSRRGDTYDADRRQAAQELIELNREFDMARSIEEHAMRQMAWDEAVRIAESGDGGSQGELRGPLAAFAQITGAEIRSAGQQFVESAEYRERGGPRTGEVEVRNLLTGTSIGTSNSHLFVPVGTPTLAPQGQQRQRFFLRDVLSVQQTGLASVPYIREVSAVTNETGATAVSEASAKPEVTMQFEQDDAPIRKIAAWIQATMEALDDASTLQGYIDTRLGYMLQVREEQQILTGVGTAPHMKGILSFTGGSNLNIQTQGSTELFEGVGVCIGKVENVDGDADGVAVNPLDYWAAVTDRHNTFFDGNAVNGGGGGAPFAGPAPTIWGLPAIRTRALSSGTAVVGAWRLGATLFEREGITLRSTDSHASLFVSNTVVILAEERVGLAVHRPDFFVQLTVAAPS